MVNSVLKHLSYKLFPGRCLLCLGATHCSADICAGCEQDLPWLKNRCLRCALPLTTEGLCGSCLKQAPRFDRCLACWEYGFPIDGLISRFKYHGDLASGALLGELALTSFKPDFIDGLLPVPMHWRRRLQRGYNQTELLATQWGAALNIPVLRPLKRVVATPTQQGLSAHARRRNLQGAFTLVKPKQVRGKRLVIVDDVLTTGATANSLAAILRRAGATEVSVWCLARTP